MYFEGKRGGRRVVDFEVILRGFLDSVGKMKLNFLIKILNGRTQFLYAIRGVATSRLGTLFVAF